jgi:alkyl hydroperoxide reductase subunit D
MSALETLRAAIPEAARDIRLNVQTVMQPGVLSPEQRWGVAVAAAVATRNLQVRHAVTADALREVGPAVVDDAQAAGALMAMNNVYYRFRHLVGKPEYAQKPARLRMNRMAQPATNRLDFELFSLAVSAINGCGACLSAHEEAVASGGLTTEHVHDAVRIAATIQAAAVALEMSDVPAPAATA